MQTNRQFREALRAVVQHGDVSISINAPTVEDRDFFEDQIKRVAAMDSQLSVYVSESPNTQRTIRINRREIVLPTTAIAHLYAIFNAIPSAHKFDAVLESHTYNNVIARRLELRHSTHFYSTAPDVKESDIIEYILGLNVGLFDSKYGVDFFETLEAARRFCFTQRSSN